ncbi:hypothetical protein [Thalassotalea crassostreae]|uniref:hypothetical protein n=1 Tax=Thalassotalea crassostreae TaxID=1763536 RepID=UPI0018DF688A|nr:hypothetical protein [Thalassotalea crassostreae]
MFAIVACIVARFSFPFGDEPDYNYRAYQIIQDSHPIISPYHWLEGMLSNLDINSNCQINSTPTSLNVSIDAESCQQPFYQALIRIFIALFFTIPILMLCVTKHKSDNPQFNFRQISILLSLCFPGFIYYLGVLADEQLVLFLSILIVLYFKNIYVVIALLMAIFAIDAGSFIVVLFFYCLTIVYQWLYSIKGFSWLLTVATIQIIVFYVLGTEILKNIPYIPIIAEKAEAMFYALESKDLVDKYPVILRPIITYMSFIFFTPAYVKSPILYAAIGCLIFYSIFKLAKNFKSIEISHVNDFIVPSIAGFVSILCIVFVFPSYVNAKYYVFMLPFFIAAALPVLSYKKIFYTFICINLMLHVNLIYFKI